MNRELFQRFDNLKREFGERAQIEGEIYAELALATGRSFVVQKVVDIQDSFVQVDARDLADPDERALSLVVPYFQINFIQFSKHKPRLRQAGFVTTS